MAAQFSNSLFGSLQSNLAEAVNALDEKQTLEKAPAPSRRRSKSNNQEKLAAAKQRYASAAEEIHEDLRLLMLNDHIFNRETHGYGVLSLEQVRPMKKLHSFLEQLCERGEKKVQVSDIDKIRELLVDVVRSINPDHPFLAKCKSEGRSGDALEITSRLAELKTKTVDDDLAAEQDSIEPDENDGKGEEEQDEELQGGVVDDVAGETLEQNDASTTGRPDEDEMEQQSTRAAQDDIDAMEVDESNGGQIVDQARVREQRSGFFGMLGGVFNPFQSSGAEEEMGEDSDSLFMPK